MFSLLEGGFWKKTKQLLLGTGNIQEKPSPCSHHVCTQTHARANHACCWPRKEIWNGLKWLLGMEKHTMHLWLRTEKPVPRTQTGSALNQALAPCVLCHS